MNWTVGQWNTVLLPDKTKFKFVDSVGLRRVRRPVRCILNPKYCSGTVKHGGGNIMVRGCFSRESVRPLHKIDGIMNKQMHKNIFLEKMLSHPRNKGMQWLAQSPNFNAIENLWEIVNTKVN